MILYLPIPTGVNPYSGVEYVYKKRYKCSPSGPVIMLVT